MSNTALSRHAAALKEAGCTSIVPEHPCLERCRVFAALPGQVAEVEMTQRRSGRDEAEFPMYTVPIEHVLKMTELHPYEDMQKKRRLVVFEEKLGKAMFVSHQWAGHHHPDPDLQQWRVLQEALRNIFSGVSKVGLPISAELAFGRLPCPTAADFAEESLYVWYDYFCCPQDLSSLASSFRAGAIRSIPSYVAKCEFFVILCPVVEHAQERRLLNLATWAQRGWCRTERLARELSARKVAYTIIIESPTQQTLSMDILRLLDAPGAGMWSRESDKPIVASALVQMIWNKLLYLLEQGDLHGFRFLLNRQGPCCFRGLDMEPVDGLVPGFHTQIDPMANPSAFLLARFLHQNGFTSPLQRDSAGWSPLCLAAMNGSPLLVQALLDRKASPNAARLCFRAGSAEV